MISLIGIQGTSPTTLYNALSKLTKNKKSLSIVQDTGLPNSDVLMFLSVSDLIQYRIPLAKRNATVFVLDCKEKLEEISNLDIVKSKSIEKAAKKALRLPHSKEIPLVKKIDRIKTVLDKRKSVGFLHYYNTLFYGVTNKDTRAKIKNLVFSWLADKISDKAFASKMGLLMPKRGKAKESMQSLIVITTSEEGVKLKGAIHEAKKSQDHDAIAKKHQVESYDLRYAMATIKKGLSEDNDKQQGRVPFGKKAKSK